MSWGLEELGLDTDADVRAVKRAYAQRLRHTRPDDDPEGFQQLHEAYQDALGWVERHAGEPRALPSPAPAPDTTDDTVAHVPPRRAAVEPVAPALDPSAPPLALGPSLDIEAFAQTIAHAASDCTADDLMTWLEARPELWSLQDRPWISESVLAHLLAHEVPVHEDTFDALADFFEWDDIASGVDPDELAYSRDLMHRVWVYREARLASSPFRGGRDYATPDDDDPRLVRLRRPWNRLRALLSAAAPGRRDPMYVYLNRVRLKPGSTPLEPRQVAFWRALGCPWEVTGPKMQLALLRSVILAMGWVGFALMLELADTVAGGSRSQFKGLAVTLGLATLVLGSTALPLWGLVRWQVGAEHPRNRSWLLRLMVIPAMTCGAWWLIQMSRVPELGICLAWVTAVLAGVRLWRRGPFQMTFSPWMIGVAVVLIPMLKPAMVVLVIGEIPLVASVLFWSIDAITQVPISHAPRRKPKRSDG